jgi:Uma2 family endonuclease
MMSAVLTPTFAPPTAPPLPIQAVQAGLRRFTVAEYHELIRIGILTEDDNLELLNGYLVHKMSRNPPHDSTLQRLNRRLIQLLPAAWQGRIQSAVTLDESEPEPDVAIVRGDENTFDNRHPKPTDFGIAIEIAESSLDADRTDKFQLYAAAGVPEYWIVNLIDRQVEVYTAPQPAAAPPAYAARRDYRPGDAVPLVLDGATVATLPVNELLP